MKGGIKAMIKHKRDTDNESHGAELIRKNKEEEKKRIVALTNQRIHKEMIEMSKVNGCRTSVASI